MISEDADPRRGERLFSWAVFPVAIFGSVALSLAVFANGGSDGLAFSVGMGFGYAVVLAGERLYPFVPAWNRNHGDVATDAAWLGSIVATGVLLGPATAALGAWLGSSLSAQVNSPLWPRQWPLAAQLVLALVVVEFFQYWTHRFEHRWDWLWRFHATHHSAPRLYWLNAARFHPIDIALVNAGYIIPLVALGAEAPVFILWIVVSSVHGISQHANMQIRCGPLNWVFSMAELHRWHHSRLVEESNTNYGQTLIVWDILFGTRFLPADRRPPRDIGIANLPSFPMTWWAQLWSPLRWARIKRESAAALIVVLLMCGCEQSEPGVAQMPAPTSVVIPPAATAPPSEVKRPSEILLSGKNLYSQNKEELIIRDFFQDRRGGFFLDVGSAWPIFNSTTYYLEKHLGWKGIAVDALADYGPAWAEKRPASKFVSYAVTDRSGETMTFYRHAWTEVSSLSKKHASRFGGEESLTPIEVQTITLTDLLDDNAITKIDHLTIDIEGAELMALAGFDIQRFKPDLVCIEAHNRGSQGESEIRQYFEANGYEVLDEYEPYEKANWYFAPKARENPSAL